MPQHLGTLHSCGSLRKSSWLLVPAIANISGMNQQTDLTLSHLLTLPFKSIYQSHKIESGLRGWLLETASWRWGRAAHLTDSSGGWVISKTNFSTGRCSLSKITTTTFSTSFCKDRSPSQRGQAAHSNPTLPPEPGWQTHTQICSVARTRSHESRNSETRKGENAGTRRGWRWRG